jgi:hypothetical protein
MIIYATKMRHDFRLGKYKFAKNWNDKKSPNCRKNQIFRQLGLICLSVAGF